MFVPVDGPASMPVRSRRKCIAAIEAATDLEALKAVRLAHAGDRSPLALANREIGALPPSAKAEAGKRVGQAIETGFDEAMSAIIDANVTTFIAALVMFFLGSGPVKGFAVTLTIGLVTSVFTAIYLTRLMIAVWYDRTRPKQLIL